MADITKCTNTDCPIMRKCYRHRAADFKVWQAYALFRPDYSTGKCEHFMPMFRIIPKGARNNVKS